MSEINIDEIQSSLKINEEGGDAGDILKSLANPESGITKLLSTVSQKMISKMASGEIRQESLLEDAMKFSSKLGSSGLMPGLGNMGSMLNMMQKMSSNHAAGDSDDDTDMDMSSLQNIMKGMVENMGNAGPGKAKTETRVDQSKLNRVIKAKQLRRKLEQRKKEKENV
jgi:hypothetical protein